MRTKIRQIGRLDSRMVYRFDVSVKEYEPVWETETRMGNIRTCRQHVLTFCCSEDSSASPDSEFWTTDIVFSNQDDSPLNNREDYALIWEPGDEPLGDESPCSELEYYGIWVRHSLDAERESLVPKLVDEFYRH